MHGGPACSPRYTLWGSTVPELIFNLSTQTPTPAVGGFGFFFWLRSRFTITAIGGATPKNGKLRRIDRKDQQKFRCSGGAERKVETGTRAAGARTDRAGAAAPKVGAGERSPAVSSLRMRIPAVSSPRRGSPAVSSTQGGEAGAVSCAGGAVTVSGATGYNQGGGGEECTSTSAQTSTPESLSGNRKCRPLPHALGPPFAGPRAQECDPPGTFPHLVSPLRSPCNPRHSNAGGRRRLGFPCPLLCSPWWYRGCYAGTHPQTFACCTTNQVSSRQASCPHHHGGVPHRWFSVPPWKRRRDQPTLKPAHGEGRIKEIGLEALEGEALLSLAHKEVKPVLSPVPEEPLPSLEPRATIKGEGVKSAPKPLLKPPPLTACPATENADPCPMLWDLPSLDLEHRSVIHQAQFLTWFPTALPLQPQT
ncbi:UNVERIFIED_CONTAM: hypothetical protein FKN15_055123 [Acipenser sinensis]